jgi:hypothetical protein
MAELERFYGDNWELLADGANDYKTDVKTLLDRIKKLPKELGGP